MKDYLNDIQFTFMLDANTPTVEPSRGNFVRRILVPHWMEVLTGILVGISIIHLTIK